LKSSQICPWLVGEEEQGCRRPNSGERVAGGGEGLAYGHQELTAHLWVGLGGRGMARGVFPTAAEAAAEGSSSARGFPARKVAKLGPKIAAVG
jgi:hypothetical protein